LKNIDYIITAVPIRVYLFEILQNHLEKDSEGGGGEEKDDEIKRIR